MIPLSDVFASFASFILNFAYSELGEQIGNHEAVYRIFDDLIGALRAQLDSTKGGSDAFRTAYGVAWIQYIGVAGRMESRDAAHAICSRARNDPWTPWNVYDAAGMWCYVSAWTLSHLCRS